MKKIFEQIINNPEIEIYVATNRGQIVGFMTCGKPYKPFKDFQQEIGMLYILKEYQRQGIEKHSTFVMQTSGVLNLTA